MSKNKPIKNNRDNKENQRNNDKNLFNQMAYELAGDIGAIDNEDMLNNRKLVTGENKRNLANRSKEDRNNKTK